MRHRVGLALVVALSMAVPFALHVAAQDQPRLPNAEAQARVKDARGDAKGSQSPSAAPRLPADSTTSHTLPLPGRTLKFQATAGSIAERNAERRIEAEIGYIAYTLEGGDPAKRPVAFAINGGPGASSAWLHLGALGPWRVEFDAEAAIPSASPVLLANAETWLDFADLVFIDPAGTGYSRLERGGSSGEADGGGAPRGGDRAGQGRGPRQWSVAGDIRSIADFIEAWIAKTGRFAAPKILVGESYGGFRVPRLAATLQTSGGVGVHALVMVSPALDFGALRGNRSQPMWVAANLPPIVAAAMEARGQAVTPGAMREAETYARGEYLIDMLRGVNDRAAVERITKRVAALTGLPDAIVAQYGGRLDSAIYRREANRGSGRVSSPYDASVTGIDPDPTALYPRGDDPILTGLRAPLTSAMLDLYATKLLWKPDGKYSLLNGEVSGGWQWGNRSVPEDSMGQLKSALALDPKLVAMVAHGYTDLVTPYFVTRLLLDQVPDYGGKQRLRQIEYAGGHMFYSRAASRVKFREDARKLISDRLGG